MLSLLDKVVEFIKAKLDLLVMALMAAVAVLAPLSMYMILAYAPLEAVMGAPQKIFYYHVPLAIFCYVGFFICFVASGLYLLTSKEDYDVLAACGAEVGTLFIVLVLITGMLWGRPVWGAYWTWDPRLTTSLILFLIYAGYMMLRSQVEEPAMRAKYAAVIGIVGFVDVPIVHFSVQLWTRGIHPKIDRGPGDPGMDPMMFKAFIVSAITIFCIFLLFYAARVRLEFLNRRLGRHQSGHPA